MRIDRMCMRCWAITWIFAWLERIRTNIKGWWIMNWNGFLMWTHYIGFVFDDVILQCRISEWYFVAVIWTFVYAMSRWTEAICVWDVWRKRFTLKTWTLVYSSVHVFPNFNLNEIVKIVCARISLQSYKLQKKLSIRLYKIETIFKPI